FAAFSILFIVASRIAAGTDGTLPPPPGDTQDYDNIALQILRGRGFAIDYTDPEWKEPYRRHNEDGTYDEILSRTEPFHLTAYRPPLLPFALALTYRVIGRGFLAWRIIESLLTAFALMLVCAVAWRTFGPRVALIAAGLMFLSTTYVTYVATWGLLTEPFAIFAISVLTWSLSRLEPEPQYWIAAIGGLAMATLCLTRSLYVVWIPVLPVLMWWISREGADRRRSLIAVAIFVTFAVAPQVPWWIRNCRVTGAFMPFGTQAGTNVYAAYGDLAVWPHRGVWWWAKARQYENAYVHEIGSCKGCDEAALARYGTRGARVWALHHLRELPRLAYWKVTATWMAMDDTGPFGTVFWFAVAAPLVFWRRRRFIRVKIALSMLTVIVMNFAVIALTWSAGWRFIVPVEPLLSILAAVALASLLFGDEAIEAESFA
ncbi:MAG: ArnT family glycosyltransferase, partial [Thermoanaerobaculia bacterium]